MSAIGQVEILNLLKRKKSWLDENQIQAEIKVSNRQATNKGLRQLAKYEQIDFKEVIQDRYGKRKVKLYKQKSI